jgi:LuxR family transcriptional regulator, maltose regulon positive regulatory protein
MITEVVPVQSVDQDAIGDNPFLASKFAPADTPSFTVTRPRLIESVARGVGGPLTVITGSAGSGKSHLAASWRAGRRDDGPVAWVSLEADDGRPGTFWMYVVEALRRASSSLAPRLTPPVPSATIDRSVLHRISAALAAEPEPVVLVLDGVSQLNDAQWANDLEFVLQHSGQHLRLILIGRWSPPMPLYRYRLAGLLTEIRSDDLAFTSSETAQLLGLHGVALSEEGLATLQEHTEGWAAGLRLSACALQGRTDVADLAAIISGEETTIAEYFLGEVLRIQPPEVRRFLLQTSVLGTFTPELATTVTGRSDAHRILAVLTRENAFVQAIGSDAATYRYHPLFAELLNAQLLLEAPDQVPVLHRRAACWLGDQGQPVEAVAHAIRAQDWKLACTIAVEDYAVGQLAIEGAAGRLGQLLQRLPEQVDGPEAAVVRAALAAGAGRRDECLSEIARAEQLLNRSDGECSDALTFACLLVNMLLLLSGGPDGAQLLRWISVAETFLGAAPPSRIRSHPELGMMLVAAKGTALSRRGALDAAATALAKGAGKSLPGCEYPQVECLQQLALLEAYRGRLGRAETLARRALDLAAGCGIDHRRWPVGAEVALAWTALERYDIEAADRHLRVAQPSCGPGGEGLTIAAYAVVKSRRLQARGELRGAMNVLNGVGEATPASPVPDWLLREIELAKARMMIGAGRLDEARTIVENSFEPRPADVSLVEATLLLAEGDPAEAHRTARTIADAVGTTMPVAVDAWLLLAMLAADQQDVNGAREALRRALRCATPEAYRRAVYQVWTQLRRILRDDVELAEQYRALSGELETVRRSGPAAAPQEQPAVIERLSKRELEVLQGMAAMLPTEEIAASMYVSINTVKTHVRSILRKLSVSRRNEAVRRARSLHLI